MTEPQEFSSDFDKWVCSLLDMLRTRYYNVSVNRGSKNYTFFYYITETSTQITSILYLVPKRIDIPFHQLQADFKNNQTPKQILDLL